MVSLAIKVLVAVAMLYGLHQLFLWMEEQGWVYYWHKRGTGNAGNVLMPIQAIYQPEVNYVLEEQVRLEGEAEQDESGDPPDWDDGEFNTTGGSENPPSEEKGQQ
ncbi:MAG: hypothetical protein IT366_22095 [Candidatus Hydrogenedentes bacterium]|nr:hypothetical protein [Candidatus Hydrogenedentota bacterium]